MPEPQRGEIWMVDFEPSVGTEIRKIRPALIVSVDAANNNRSKVTLMPITSSTASLSVAVSVLPEPANGLDRPSLIKVPDITTFDKRRLKRRLGRLEQARMREVEDRLRLHLGL